MAQGLKSGPDVGVPGITVTTCNYSNSETTSSQKHHEEFLIPVIQIRFIFHTGMLSGT